MCSSLSLYQSPNVQFTVSYTYTLYVKALDSMIDSPLVDKEHHLFA